MRNWFARFMFGRYGSDAFGLFIIIVAVVFTFISAFVIYIPVRIALYLLSLGILVYGMFRLFSRNTSARILENQRYKRALGACIGWFKLQSMRLSVLKTHKLFRCPKCKTIARVPKGIGKISITCPHCGTQFIRKS